MLDVLIIGSGGAGLSAALSAKKEGSSVLVVSKTYPTHSQTSQAQAGINAVISEENDSIQTHINDTLKASHCLASTKRIEALCNNAKDTISWLDKLAMPFSRSKNNQIAQRLMGGSSNKRSCYSSDYTGLKLIHTLYDTCIKEEIDFLNECMLLNIIVSEGEAQGITYYDIQNGEIREILAKKIILATGGYGGLYAGHTTNSYATTGEVISIAYKAGCTLSNMEFVQFHPTTLIESNVLISESARGEGGHLVTANGDRFVDELKPRDEVARAISEKLNKGEQVYLDLRHLGLEKIEASIPQERRLAYEFLGIKIEEELLPINPAAHYTMGGIKTDCKAKTNVQNLYACGECAQHGIHGANRLGGNSLLEIIAYGKIAGEDAALEAQKMPTPTNGNNKQLKNDIDYVNSLFEQENKTNFYTIKEQLGNLLFDKVGLFRNQNDLDFALDTIKMWQKMYINMGLDDKTKVFNKNLLEFIEFKHMLDLSEIITKCAIGRKESRGAHFRSDYATLDKRFNKETLVCDIKNNFQLNFEEVR